MKLTREMREWLARQPRCRMVYDLALEFSARFNLAQREAGNLLAGFIREEYKLL